MKLIADELQKITDECTPALKKISREKFDLKKSPGKWSKKEILGHLIDSAQNNIRRFIVAQYEDRPKITYNQDKWVSIAGYQQWNSNDLIDLWNLLNRQICEILKNTSPGMAQRQCMTEGLHTIEWLAQDYIKHLKHHMHQVLELEPVAHP